MHIVAGYVGWYLAGRDVLGLASRWSHVLALVVVSNGFYIAHAAAGHVTFQGFTLLGALTWLLLDARKDGRFGLPLRAACMALLASWILYGGGYIVLLFWAVLMAFALPAELLRCGLRSARARILLRRVAVCGVLTLLACSSKLVAVQSIMRLLPRTVDYWRIGSFGPGGIMETLWKMPQPGAVAPFLPGDTHERLFFTSPATLIGLLLAAALAVAGTLRKGGKTRRGVAHSALLGAFVIVYAAFLWGIASGRGLTFDAVHAYVPLFRSLRVGSRFIYVIALFVSVGGVWSLARFFRRFAPRSEPFAAVFLSLLTVYCFNAALRPVINDRLTSMRDYGDCSEAQERFDQGASLPPVTSVKDGWLDYERGATGRDCPNALYMAHNPHKDVLRSGPTDAVADGAYNLLNPACAAYPEANACAPGARIDVHDTENFERFARGHAPRWNVSTRQAASDLLSLVAIAFSACLVVVRRKDARALFFAREEHPIR